MAAMRKTSLTKLAFGNIPVPESSWFVEVSDDNCVEDVPNVDRVERVDAFGAEKSLLSAFLRGAGTSSTTRIPTSKIPGDSPRISWFYDDDDNDNQDESGMFPPNMSESKEKKPYSRKQLHHCDEFKRVLPSLSTSNHDIVYLGSDDPSSSLASTDVSSFSTSSPTFCSKLGQLSMEDEDAADASTPYSSWFRGSNKLCVVDNHEEQQRHQHQSDPFFQKLPRAKEHVSANSNHQRKLSAHEGYVANFDYGVLSKNSNDNSTTATESVRRREEGYTTTKDRTIRNTDSEQAALRGVARPGPIERHEDDYSTTSARDRNLRNANHGHATPRGISRPDPLESHRAGEQEFILPTVIVASSMFVSPLSTPATAFDRPTIGNSVSTPLSYNPTSPRSTKSIFLKTSETSLDRPTVSINVSTSPLSCNRSRKSTSYSCFDLDDSSSVGGSRKSFLHYSYLGSDNIDRLIRRSDSEEEWSQPSVQALPSYLSGFGISPNRTATIFASSDLDDPSLSRIFVLLLAPETKQFELIQICDLRLSVTTIGHILDRIPTASTVPALGNRHYTGLCRPKDGIEMTAQQVPAGKVSGGWRIIRGEILIAIPLRFSGQECMKMSGQILLNPKLVKLLRRKDPLAPKKKKLNSSSSTISSKSRTSLDGLSEKGSRSTSDGRRLSSSRNSLLLQAVDENSEIHDYNVPTLPYLNLNDSINHLHQKSEQKLQVSEPYWKKSDDDSVDSGSTGFFSKAEEQVKLLKSIANSSYKISLLENVLEESNDDDDEKSIATEIWDERVRLATERNNALTDLMGMDVLVCDDITESGDRVMRIQQKNQTVDDATFKSMCAFLAALLCRHLFKGLGVVNISTPPIGATGLVYCAAIFKSLLHFQRVHNAYNDQHDRSHERRHVEAELPSSFDVSPRGDVYGGDEYGYNSWRKAANL